MRILPLATLFAILLLLIVEESVRLIPPERLLPRGSVNTAVHTDTGQSAALAMIDIRGSTDVALVGSSMMREAVNVPRMARSLRKQSKRKLSVGDYSVRGARAEEIARITHELIISKRQPKVLIIGLSLRDLQTDRRRLSALSQYWQLDEWVRESPQAPFSAEQLSLLPTCVGNTIARHSRLVRFRSTLRELVLHPLSLPPADTNPVTGDPGHNLRSYVADGQVTVKEIRKQLAKEYKTNDLTPDPPAVAALEHLINDVQSQSKNTKLILFELPIPAVMRKALPKAQYNEFLTLTHNIASKHNIPFLTASELLAFDFKPKDGYFLDSQHMNYYGNMRFADVLATVTSHFISK